MAIAFESSVAEFIDAGFEIEGELDIGAKQIGLDGLGVGPVEGLLEEEQAGDRVEFLGGPAEGGVIMLTERLDGHRVQDRGAKDSGPAGLEPLAGERREDVREGVEEGDLSGIDGMAHAMSNSMTGMELWYT